MNEFSFFEFENMSGVGNLDVVVGKKSKIACVVKLFGGRNKYMSQGPTLSYTQCYGTQYVSKSHQNLSRIVI
jgi:hypothetical protein